MGQWATRHSFLTRNLGCRMFFLWPICIITIGQWATRCSFLVPNLYRCSIFSQHGQFCECQVCECQLRPLKPNGLIVQLWFETKSVDVKSRSCASPKGLMQKLWFQADLWMPHPLVNTKCADTFRIVLSHQQKCSTILLINQ